MPRYPPPPQEIVSQLFGLLITYERGKTDDKCAVSAADFLVSSTLLSSSLTVLTLSHAAAIIRRVLLLDGAEDIMSKIQRHARIGDVMWSPITSLMLPAVLAYLSYRVTNEANAEAANTVLRPLSDLHSLVTSIEIDSESDSESESYGDNSIGSMLPDGESSSGLGR